LLALLDSVLHVSPDHIVLALGLMTFAATAYVILKLPDFFVRFVLWLVTHSVYRIQIVGRENIPARGAALLVSNHVSFVDAFLIGGSMQRFVRFMLHRDYYDMPWLNRFFRLLKAIPVSSANRREIVGTIRRAQKELADGHVVCIFAEGGITRTGHVMAFKRGFEKIAEPLNVPIIPVHLDQVWGSIFSYKNGRFFWKWPNILPYPVTVSFGAPLPPSTAVQTVRQAVLALESEAARHRPSARELLHTKFIATAKRHWFSFCMADTTGREITFGRALTGGLLFAGWVEKNCSGQSMVGILIPGSVGGALANIAVLLAGKIPVNLNFTAGPEAMASAIQQCGIQTIITSRSLLSKAGIEQTNGMVFLENIAKRFGRGQQLVTMLYALLTPSPLLRSRYTRRKSPDDLATVIFSSGSTGAPKGVMLSHYNIVSNIESICQVIQFDSNDRIMGVLPLFHSFGFAITLWLPLMKRVGVVYHANPMDARTIGETVRKYKATLLISTPTFYANYVRRCSREEFATLRYAIAGAEKLREQIAQGFKEKFGLDLLEGYGCTELSPVVSVNIPDIVDNGDRQIGTKAGTVGHPIPGVIVKVVDAETEQPLKHDAEGSLLVKGPNVMLGYLGNPEATANAIHDGWYITGDIGSVDEDGFIRITDRLARFSKLGGEMIPHGKIEEAINSILGNAASAVTSIPDEQKGEKLVAFYTQNGITRDQLWEQLNESDLPKLWIPKRENLFLIESIPVLGTGKIDLKQVKRLALEKTADQQY
jgi:acyl-[acyl-carrier-protein]-phospholipid O-acyltransferase/long-chain-fatty-acid--[acyl-carrier-protein] ligase